MLLVEGANWLPEHGGPCEIRGHIQVTRKVVSTVPARSPAASCPSSEPWLGAARATHRGDTSKTAQGISSKDE